MSQPDHGSDAVDRLSNLVELIQKSTKTTANQPKAEINLLKLEGIDTTQYELLKDTPYTRVTEMYDSAIIKLEELNLTFIGFIAK